MAKIYGAYRLTTTRLKKRAKRVIRRLGANVDVRIGEQRGTIFVNPCGYYWWRRAGTTEKDQLQLVLLSGEGWEGYQAPVSIRQTVKHDPWKFEYRWGDHYLVRPEKGGPAPAF